MAEKESLDSENEAVELKEEEATPGEEVEEATEELIEVERLEEELEEARGQADEYLDGWRRAQAEFANYKKRQRAEQGKVRELANANLLRKLLPVMDDFERAFATMPLGLGKLSWTQGLLMVKRKLEAVLETEGVEPIETEGEAFDPYYHEAVTYEELHGYEEGQIIGEVQTGYVLGDRVLRPALVRVAKGTETTVEDEGDGPAEPAEDEAEDSPRDEE